MQGLARCYQTQIETNTGLQLSATSPAIPVTVRYAGFVLTRFTLRPDGRTTFQFLFGACISLVRVGESGFYMISDREVGAVKLTNRWISGCWWRRDALSDEHLVGTKFGLLRCRSLHREPLGEQWSRRETGEARGTKWHFVVEMDVGVPASVVPPRLEAIPTGLRPALSPRHDSQESEMRGLGVDAMAIRIRAFWCAVGRTPGCPAFETRGLGDSDTRECKTFQDAWEESRRTATACCAHASSDRQSSKGFLEVIFCTGIEGRLVS